MSAILHLTLNILLEHNMVWRAVEGEMEHSLYVYMVFNLQNVSVRHNNNKYETYNVIAGLHVSTLTESSSGLHDTDTYKESTMHCGILNAHNICILWALGIPQCIVPYFSIDNARVIYTKKV